MYPLPQGEVLMGFEAIRSGCTFFKKFRKMYLLTPNGEFIIIISRRLPVRKIFLGEEVLDLMEKEYERADFCRCKKCSSVATEDTGFGFWLTCCDCGKRIEDSFEYYNHYDGEDHVVDPY